ncbi:MAG: class I SAM-dependent DNA methyltransferase [Kiritimatiellae bacterium]|nr:class I SAM-dependent DNA methyltransferase [Kiritimatiellia bacterium]
MTPQEQKQAARDFVAFWTGKGYEKGQTQPFWIGLLRVLGVEHPDQGCIEFEDKAHIDAAHGFIDGYIPATHVLIEQKSLGKNLRAGIPQSDGSVLKPYQQALRYSQQLPYSLRPRWIVTCNFAEFDIYDMERPNAEPERLLLQDLPNECYRLSFLVDTGSENIRREEEISKAAGDVVGDIHAGLLANYRDPANPASLKSLNELCVRLVFLLYAEDAGIFPRLLFHDYLARHRSRARAALVDLFKVLDTPPDKRDPYLDGDLAAFPYVNGGLFANENVEIPQLDETTLDLILKRGSEDFDWSGISPVIFGAVFESTLNPETRRKEGMHYTSVANIHKVIDPLFLDALKAELADIKREPGKNVRDAALRAFTDRLASLIFLDPACGSGNFLTETYICLRRLENEALALFLGGQSILDFDGSLVKVGIRQFHGIEYNDFACRVAQTALWIAENQMLRETETLLHRNLDFLPLKTYDGIVEGNALRLDWNALAPHFDYIMGNPPFVGAMLATDGQKEDMAAVFGKDWKGLGELDYVAGWYKKAFDYMAAHPATRAALVSTNSVTQGQAVASLFGPLMEQGLSIDFAHRTFRWDSESNSKAHVHCVIVGFSCRGAGISGGAGILPAEPSPCAASRAGSPRSDKPLFAGERMTLVPHINAYLLAAPDVVIGNRSAPLCDVPPMHFGNMPRDGGALLLSPEERDELLAAEPQAAPLVRPILGAEEFIKGRKRYCLWLVGASPALLNRCPRVLDRIRRCRDFRLASKAASTRKFAETPALFCQITQPEGKDYIAVPRVSSESRRYIPMGFLTAETKVTDLLQIIPSATLYHFGVLTSNVHMAWMRAVAGRLKSDYRYSKDIVYNNFPWPAGGAGILPAESQAGDSGGAGILPAESRAGSPRSDTAATAQAILDARAKYPDSTLADLYNELTMPPDLRAAHQANDRAVMAAYGFSTKMTESECVAELFKRYQALVAQKNP